MQEPEYIFVKGQGWILGNPNPNEVICENRWGKYKIIGRLPKADERYGIFPISNNNKYIVDGKLQIQVFADYLCKSDAHIREYALRRPGTQETYYTENEDHLFCTIILLEEYARP